MLVLAGALGDAKLPEGAADKDDGTVGLAEWDVGVVGVVVVVDAGDEALSAFEAVDEAQLLR